MAFNLQTDGGGVEGANAYVSVAEFKTYHDDRGQSYGTATDVAIQNAIVQATSYLDSRFRFVGEKLLGRGQTTQWPRSSAYDADRDLINGIPVEVKQACCEYALRALTTRLNPDPARDATGALITMKKEVVGPIEETIQYQDSPTFRLPRYPTADMILTRAGLVRAAGELRRG